MMVSAFNRIVVTLAALMTLAGAVITIGVASQVWPPDILLGWFQPQLQMAADSSGAMRAAAVSLSVVIVVGMAALLIAELLPLKTTRVHTLSTSEKGTATIENDSLCLLAERTGEAIHGVNDVQCFIREEEAGLHVMCNAHVVLGTNLLEVNPEMRAKVRESLQQLTGLAVSQIDIKFKYQSDRRSRVAVR
jgi:hypothetical protein